MAKLKRLNFTPLFGLSSKHLQTILPSFRSPGDPPPSQQWIVQLDDGDRLSCEVSKPPNHKKTVLLIHGLGGSQSSPYMVRLSRRLYDLGYQVIRVNLRRCGSGAHLAKKPYYSGCSHDILQVLQSLNEKALVVGFSLGGNIAIKLAAELGASAPEYVESFLAICAPISLAETLAKIQQPHYFIYHYYYLKGLIDQSKDIIPHTLHSIYEFDKEIICPIWGYANVEEYYDKCSSIRFLPSITHKTKLLYAEDDPFISLDALHQMSLHDNVEVYTTQQGGHMGYLGMTSQEFNYYWLDQQITQWITHEN